MTVKQKKERRYLVTAIDPIVLAEAEAKGHVTVIGYWDSPETDVLMIRRTPGRGFYELIKRRGSGVVREEEFQRLEDVRAGDFLLETCPYRLMKKRVVRDGWKLDVFLGRLSGLVVAEIEVSDVASDPPAPPWMRERIEVTDRVTNLHFARLAADLERSGEPDLPRSRLHARIPRIVLTGGPCSGKSTLIEELARTRADVLHCVPETATIVIAQVGIRPPLGRPLEYFNFQRTIFGVQRHFEEASADQAARDGKKALLLDRGELDSAAYLPGGRDEFLRMTRTSLAYELGQYDLVVCLEPPPRDVYDAKKAGNPARYETYDEAVAVGERIKAAWAGHPGLVVIPNGSGWDEKRAAALAAVDAFLARLS